MKHMVLLLLLYKDEIFIFVIFFPAFIFQPSETVSSFKLCILSFAVYYVRPTFNDQVIGITFSTLCIIEKKSFFPQAVMIPSPTSSGKDKYCFWFFVFCWINAAVWYARCFSAIEIVLNSTIFWLKLSFNDFKQDLEIYVLCLFLWKRDRHMGTGYLILSGCSIQFG